MAMDLFDKLNKKCKLLDSESILAMGIESAQNGDIEKATYLYEILKTRKRQKFSNQLQREMAKLDIEPISFLMKARDITRTYKRKTKGTSNVYIVLLDGYLKDDRYGLYVGKTSKTVEERLAEHKSGKNAAQCNKKMRVHLYSLFEHLNPLSASESGKIENAIAAELRATTSIRTEGGDKKIKTETSAPN
jgi:predicted GIY-YIG superfamily endonuclease